MSEGNYKKFYAVVRRIPEGRVATYGQVAELAGLPGHARQVGYALHALPEGSNVPWQRVINAKGEVSERQVPGANNLQRALLEQEGVRFDSRDRIDLKAFRWSPRKSSSRSSNRSSGRSSLPSHRRSPGGS